MVKRDFVALSNHCSYSVSLCRRRVPRLPCGPDVAALGRIMVHEDRLSSGLSDFAHRDEQWPARVAAWNGLAGRARHDVRGFLSWANQHGHCRPLAVPAPTSNRGADTKRRPAVDTGRLAAPRRHHRTHRPGRRLAAAALRPATVPDHRDHYQPDHHPLRQTFLRFGHAEVTTPTAQRPAASTRP